MRSQRLREWTGAALVPLAALGVHQARYLLAFGGGSGRELAVEGHHYLTGLAPWIVVSCAVALGLLLTRVTRAWRTGRSETSPRLLLLCLWLVSAAGLVVIYTGQELLEGLLASGHPGGLAGVFGHGGLWALPSAGAIGLLLAAVIRGASRVVAIVARLARRRTRSVPRAELRPQPFPAAIALPVLAPLATAAAGRAPPPAVLDPIAP